MIDLPAHILPGFDDGVRSIEEARELARAAAAEGITAIAATPHVRGDYPTSVESACFGACRCSAPTSGASPSPSRCSPAASSTSTGCGSSTRTTSAGSRWRGRGRWLLVEMPYAGWPPNFERKVAALRAQGIETLLAHPERNDAVQRVRRLAPLVAEGVRVQVTAASVDGRLGAKSGAAAGRARARG